MTERLTEKTDEGILVKESHGDNVMKTLYQCHGAEPLPNYSNCDEGYYGMEKLAEYETAEEEGRLVVLPCDTVYFIWNKSSGISHVRAKSILDLSLREILGIDKDGRYWSAKEEAEKALEEMKKNE